ncbi:unnamed protein product [Polarella glacialis]|uniref:Uncharacterized protein n=1 Tax=Polarella glacialis TaxID=89957 RepID=A0A813KF62_POLGL|nr:unnamed protein product [Polarella glacialis]
MHLGLKTNIEIDKTAITTTTTTANSNKTSNKQVQNNSNCNKVAHHRHDLVHLVCRQLAGALVQVDVALLAHLSAPATMFRNMKTSQNIINTPCFQNMTHQPWCTKLHTMLEMRRPMPLMAVRANITLDVFRAQNENNINKTIIITTTTNNNKHNNNSNCNQVTFWRPSTFVLHLSAPAAMIQHMKKHSNTYTKKHNVFRKHNKTLLKRYV